MTDFIDDKSFTAIENFLFSAAAKSANTDLDTTSTQPEAMATEGNVQTLATKRKEKRLCHLARWRFYNGWYSEEDNADCRHKICIKYDRLLKTNEVAAKKFYKRTVKWRIAKLRAIAAAQDCTCCESSEKYFNGYHCPCCSAKDLTKDLTTSGSASDSDATEQN